MIRDGIRHVPTRPPAQSRPHPEVAVLEVEEIVLVEEPDVVEHAAPVERDRRAREEHLGLLGPARPVELLPTARAIDPVGVDEEAGGVDARLVGRDEDPWREHAGVDVALGGGDQLREARRCEAGVVVERQDQIAARAADPEVVAARKAAIGVETDDRRRAERAARDVQRVVRRAVVDDDRLDIAKRLRRDAHRALTQQRAPIVIHDHDRDARHARGIG